MPFRFLNTLCTVGRFDDLSLSVCGSVVGAPYFYDRPRSPTTHKITFGTLRRGEERRDKMEVLYKGEDTLPPSFISLIAHGYD